MKPLCAKRSGNLVVLGCDSSVRQYGPGNSWHQSKLPENIHSPDLTITHTSGSLADSIEYFDPSLQVEGRHRAIFDFYVNGWLYAGLLVVNPVNTGPHTSLANSSLRSIYSLDEDSGI